jgi:hypothetical protein
VASPPVGWSAVAASSSSGESESTTMLWECPRWVAHLPESTSSLGSSEALGPASLAAESCFELATGALGGGPSVTPFERKGP